MRRTRPKLGGLTKSAGLRASESGGFLGRMVRGTIHLFFTPLQEAAMTPQAAVKLESIEANGFEVEVVERNDTPNAWSVEAIDVAGDGAVYMATFSGPEARARAEEYANMKYGL